MPVLAALALAISLALGLQPPQAATGSERTPVRIDAVATDARGRNVADLAPADFEISDENGPRAIEEVRLIRADGSLRPGEAVQPILSAADEQVEAAREGTRL